MDASTAIPSTSFSSANNSGSGGSGSASLWAALRDNLVFAGFVVMVVFIIGLLSYLVSKPHFSHAFQQRMRELVRDSARWSATAEQDQNPALELSHASYGVAYLNVARSLASDRELETITGMNIPELASIVSDREQKAIGKALSRCGTPGPAAVYTGYL